MSLGDSLQFLVGLDTRQAEQDLRSFVSFAHDVVGTVSGMVNVAREVGSVLGSGLRAGADALAAITSSGSEMETFASRLTTIMGSASAARQRMGELFDYAASTPFNLDEVVAADVTLRGFGADAQALLPKLIDFSAALGTDLRQAAVDFGKAWSQGGAGLESDTGKILKSMIEAKAGIKTADMSITEFRKNMAEVLDEKFAGGAQRLSQTFAGMMSNLQDEWSRFKLEIADAGIFNNIKGALATILEDIGKNRTEIKALAGDISSGLWTAIKSIAVEIGIVVDSVRLFGAVLEGSKGFAAEVGETLIDWIRPAIEGLDQVSRFLYGPEATEGLKKLDESLGTARASLAGVEAGAKDAIRAFDPTAASSAIAGFFASAEAKAKQYGTVVEDALASGNKPGSAPGKSPSAEKLAEAQKFLSDLASLNADAVAKADIKAREELDKLKALYAQKLITAEQYSAALEQIDAEQTRARAAALEAQRQAHEKYMEDLAASERQAADQLAVVRASPWEMERIEAQNTLNEGILAEAAAYAQRLEQYQQFVQTKFLVGQQAADALAAIEEGHILRIQTLNEQAAQKQQQAQLSTINKYAEAVEQVLNGLASLMDQHNAKQRAAAKALGISEVIVRTAVAVANAFPDPVLMAAAGAMGAIQIANIAKAHQGRGPRYAHQGDGPAPDERDTRILNTEAVLNSQATRALGPDGVRELNSGGMRTVSVVTQIGRKLQREMFREEMRAEGPMMTRIRSLMSADTIDAGFSGRAALA
jgi:hypothetical protein